MLMVLLLKEYYAVYAIWIKNKKYFLTCESNLFCKRIIYHKWEMSIVKWMWNLMKETKNSEFVKIFNCGFVCFEKLARENRTIHA